MATTALSSRGFTLIELMITVVVVGILAAIAYPNYQSYVIKGNRTDARTALLDASQALERCFTQYSKYNNSGCGPTFPVTSQQGFYSVTATRDASTFTLTATPVSGKIQASDAKCTTLTLTNAGVRGATGSATAECW